MKPRKERLKTISSFCRNIANSMGNILLAGAIVGNSYASTALGGGKIQAVISYHGINRITNAPYQLVEVAGVEKKYELKSDIDGKNIYLIPHVAIGEKIELSIKNNIGIVHDLELLVKDVPGQMIDLSAQGAAKQSLNLAAVDAQDLQQMLNAMAAREKSKFLVQEARKSLMPIGGISVEQEALYRWRNIWGAVFVLRNDSSEMAPILVDEFVERFDLVKLYYAPKRLLAPGERAEIFIIQEAR